MPRLRSVALNINSFERFKKAEIHSAVISAILLAPCLREFRIACPFFTHEVPLLIHRQLKIPPLTRFSYLQATYAAYPRAAPPQYDFLTIVLEQVPETLQELISIIEPLPLHTIRQNIWPQLRVLDLYGERQTVPGKPYITLFSQMPRLKELTLVLADPQGGDQRHAVWPLGHPAVYPWPELESLTLTQPHPDDQLFRHLPASMRRLTLRYFPHPYVFYLGRDGPLEFNYLDKVWNPPSPLSALEMISILRQCAPRVPDLTDLVLEFQGDRERLDVLRCVASSLPRLRFFQFYWYEGEEDLRDPDVVRHITSCSWSREIALTM